MSDFTQGKMQDAHYGKKQDLWFEMIISLPSTERL